MKRYFSILGFLSLLCLDSQSARRQSTGTDARVIRVLCLPARPLALVVAREQHIFEKFGIEVQAEVASNSEALRAGLADEKFDLAHAAVDNAVALAEKNATDVVVVMGGEGSTNELIAQPTVHSIAELRGKTVIVDAPRTAYALQLRKMLLRSQLQVGRDYQIKAVGSTPVRLAALRETPRVCRFDSRSPHVARGEARRFPISGNNRKIPRALSGDRRIQSPCVGPPKSNSSGRLHCRVCTGAALDPGSRPSGRSAHPS